MTRLRAILRRNITLICPSVAELQQRVARQQPYASGDERNIGVTPLELDQNLAEAEGGTDGQGSDIPKHARRNQPPPPPDHIEHLCSSQDMVRWVPAPPSWHMINDAAGHWTRFLQPL